MKWVIAAKSDFNSFLDFILEKEWEHTFLTANIIENGVFTLPQKSKYPILILKDKSRIKAACMITFWGALFPVFKSIDMPNEKEMLDLSSWLKKNVKKIYSIMGTEERVQLISKYLSIKERTLIDYNLMIKEHTYISPHKPDIDNLFLKKACPDDSAVLLSLEIEYQKEEVFLDPSLIKSSHIYHNLRTTLNNQTIYYLTKGITPIAKAGTNAVGHKWNQIGGVYTDREFRNRGISTWLMDEILKILEKDGKKTVLFVKENNKAAEKVYTKLGFAKKKRFIIIYYL